ncbi:MAG: aryl-sulfate sulfotransferase [Armatimonadetes bacterium]|nr:aryl-sulfate sulfotransferase [Armatimonadota bacterium]
MARWFGYLVTALLLVAVVVWAGQEAPPAAPRSPHSLRPPEKARLHTRHVLFDWLPIAGATAYRLQIAEIIRAGEDPFAGLLAAELTLNAPQQVVAAGLDWGRSYAWRVQPLTGSESSSYAPAGAWSPTHRFSIEPLPEHCPPTVAKQYRPGAYHPGLTLFNVSSVNKAFGGKDAGIALAVDSAGQIVWFRYEPYRFTDLHLLPNGNVLFASHEVAYEATLDGRVVWRTPPGHRVHHDVTRLPNGNLLCLVYDERRVTFRGRRETWQGDAVEEITRAGRVIWRWSVFDYLPINEMDEVSYRKWKRDQEPYDWTHCNAAHYDGRHNAIYLSVRNLSCILKIDRRTKKIVWRMGSGGNIGQGFFSYQHAPQLLSNDHLLVYDNGNRRDGRNADEDAGNAFSRAIEIALTAAQPPAAKIVWEYRLPYSQGQGEVDRLSNGSSLIADGYNGRILEVSAEGQPVWELTLPGGKPRDYIIYRSERVPGLYPQFGNPPVIQ